MPTSKRKPCAYASCMILTHDRWCEKHTKDAQWVKNSAGQRRSKMYKTKFWKNARRIHLENNPLCVECGRTGRDTIATVVDHVIPHRGDQEKFDDPDNYQGLCEFHHNQKTSRGE